jgi:L-Ala-D/L-Glu epimerase
MTFDIRPISSAETYPLRLRVLRPNRPPQSAQFAEDDLATHFGAFVSGHLAAVATIFEQPLADEPRRAWQLRGMAVDEAFRGQYLGAALLRECETFARSQGAELLWCNARESACGFYAKHGFAIRGTRFEIPDVGPHFVMLKAL